MRSKNAEKCKNYRKRKKEASLIIKKAPLTPAERSRMYRLRKKQLSQGIKLSVNEVPSTLNSRMMFEPSPQPVTTGSPDTFNTGVTNLTSEEATSRRIKDTEGEGSRATLSTIKVKTLAFNDKVLNNFKERKRRKPKASSMSKNNKNQDNYDPTFDKTQNKPFKCNVCPLSFRFVSHYERHVRSHTGEKPFQCDTCQKCFSIKGNLENHIRIHTGTKPYHCNVCQKSFSDRTQYNKHCRIHSGIKPYQCNVCQKEFSAKSHLTVHERIHSNEKPYQCEVCQKGFRTKCNLTTHSRIHTGERPYMCELCEIYFTSRSNLGTHNRRVHKKKAELKKPMPVYLLKRVSDGKMVTSMNIINKVEIIIGDQPVSESSV